MNIMDINRFRKDLQIGITYFCIFALSLNLFFSLTGIAESSEILRLIIIGILAVNFFTDPNKAIKKADAAIFVLSAVYFLLFGQSVALNILVLYLISFYLRDDEPEHIKSRLLFILAVISVIWLAMLLSGFLRDRVSTAFGRTRHYLGFKNINQSSLFYFPMLILMFDRYRKEKILRFAAVLLSLLMFVLTNTRAAFYAFIIFAVISLLSEELIPYRNTLDIAVTVLLNLFTAFFLMSKTIAAMWPEIDELTTYRLSIIGRNMEKMNAFNFIFGAKELLLDNSYIMLFSTFGLAGYVFFIYIVSLSLKNSEAYDWSILTAVLFYGFSESTMFIPESVLAILFFCILQKNSSSGSAPFCRPYTRYRR